MKQNIIYQGNHKAMVKYFSAASTLACFNDANIKYVGD